jgi:hypothetical protein
MGTTKDELRDWFDLGLSKGQAYMIVACDTYDWEDFPVYAKDAEEARLRFRQFNGPNMQKVMEVYDLSMDRETQMAEHRAWHLPSD